MDQMIKIQNTEVPAVGLGTWRLYGKECTRLVELALDIGYRHLDTAQLYENEMAVGDALEASTVAREEIYLATKVSVPNMNFGHAYQSVENSLRMLKTDFLDLVLLHAPPANSAEEVLEQLMPLYESGKVKHFGLSNFYGERFSRLVEEYNFPLITNQIEWHPFVDTQSFAEQIWQADMFVTAYAPLARGHVLEDQTLTEIAEQHGKTNSQVALRWLLQHGKTAVIPKTADDQRLKENIDLFDFELSDEEVNRINNLPKDGRIINGPWLEGAA